MTRTLEEFKIDMAKSLEQQEKEYWDNLVRTINKNDKGLNIRNSSAISAAYRDWVRTHRTYIESLEDFS